MKRIHTFVVLAYEESKYLEECIKSVLKQSIKSTVFIATSTPNDLIYATAKKYDLKIIENNNLEKGIGNDFDFAIKIADTELVTIAHQDDIYDYCYTEDIIKAYKKSIKYKPIIIFSDYYEIRNKKKVYSNINLKIKRFLFFPLKIYKLGKYCFFKRWILRFGNSISCPAVTFVKSNIIFPVFASKYKCNVDWNAWEKLSRLPGAFILVPKKNMGHRVHNQSTTTEILKNNDRSKEDYDIFTRFWPKWIAKILTSFYKNSEDSNKL